MTKEPIKIGIIGLDTSHVKEFTGILNDPKHIHHISGGIITAAYPGGSDDFELSYSRVEGFTNLLRDQYGVAILDSPEEVAASCDAILLTTVDGRLHLEQFRKIAPFGKPVFIDKPFTTASSDARQIIELADKYNVPCMSSSSLRYAEELTKAVSEAGQGEVIGMDCYGPMELESTQPGLFWYGIHSAEMLFNVLGQDWVEVKAVSNKDYDLITGVWADGRIGTLRGNRKGNSHFGALLHREQGTRFIDVNTGSKPYYVSMLEKIMELFRGGNPAISLHESLQIVRFIEAANVSRETGLAKYSIAHE